MTIKQFKVLRKIDQMNRHSLFSGEGVFAYFARGECIYFDAKDYDLRVIRGLIRSGILQQTYITKTHSGRTLIIGCQITRLGLSAYEAFSKCTNFQKQIQSIENMKGDLL